MKKFSLALTILTAVSFAAQAQTVGSANIMGYTKLTTPTAGSFDLLALTQFSDGTTNNTLSIQDVISNLSDLNSDGLGSGATGADKLYVYNGSGYDQYALFQPAAGDPYWASISEGGWTSGLEFLGVNPANVTVELGAGFWFETATGKTIGFEKIYNIN